MRKGKPRNENPKKNIIFLETELSSSNIKKSPYIFKNGSTF